MWCCNAGYILYELLEWESKGAQYFAMDSLINIFDTIISVNWIILFVLRVMAGAIPALTGENYYGEPPLDPTIDRNLTQVIGTSAETRTDPAVRNERYTILYMALWSIQIIILWVRIVGLLQRTEMMGPLLRMMIYVAKDILQFLILVVAISTGFLWAVYYIVGGDIDRDVTCDALLEEYQWDDCEEASEAINSVRGITIYLIQTLLGQQDWEVLDTNELYGFERGRAQLLTMCILGYVICGTILSLNMLIAIMTTSFDLLNEEAKQQLAFLRVETTYDLAHRGRMMPPPYNIFVLAVWLLITLVNGLIKILSCGKCKLNLDGINPLYINCLRRGSQHGYSSSIIKRENNKSQRNYSVSKAKEDIKNKLQRLETKSNLDNDKDDNNDLNKLKPDNKSAMTLRFDAFSELFEEIDSLADDTKKRYCKHCYCRMRNVKDGKIDDYFEFFTSSSEQGGGSSHNTFGLDKDDMRMIKRLFRYCALCPQCFRPYSVWTKPQKGNKNNNNNNNNNQSSSSSSDDNEQQAMSRESIGDLGTDRYDRHHVLVDVISCYFFLLLVWIPLVIIMFVPAMFSRLAMNMTMSEKTAYASNKQLDAGAFGDYHRGVEQQVVKEIVDKKYNGTTAFDDEFDSDDERDQITATNNNDKLHSMLLNVMQKVNDLAAENDKKNKAKKGGDGNNEKKKLTTIQLQKKLEIEQHKKELEQEEKKDEQKDHMMALMMSTTELKKSIRSSKTANEMANELDLKQKEEDTKIEEEEPTQDKYNKTKVTFKDEIENVDDGGDDNDNGNNDEDEYNIIEADRRDSEEAP